MSKSESIMIREVTPSDLDIFYTQELDPEAIRMAAFVSDRQGKPAFLAHWAKILVAPRTTNRTIVVDGQVAGHVACYPDGETLEATYWVGREFWGQGIATAALQQMLRLVTERPITARAATDNGGSLKVLQKCGFKIIGQDQGFAHGRGQDTEEYLLRLDPAPPSHSMRDQPTPQEIARVRTAYAAFNARNIDGALATMTADVAWPRAFKGGFVKGPEAIRAYWSEQWSEINPHVEPVAFHREPDGRILVEVHQVVRDLAGNVLADGPVDHRFTLAQGLIHKMEVGPTPLAG